MYQGRKGRRKQGNEGRKKEGREGRKRIKKGREMVWFVTLNLDKL